MKKRTKKLPDDKVKEYNTRETKQWCRGKRGVEHATHWVPAFRPHHITGLTWSEDLVCKNCKKKIDHRRSRYTFGTLVKLGREQRGWTQQELADKMGSTQVYICQVESDTAVPTIKTVAKFAHALKAEYRLAFMGMPIKVDGYEEIPDWERTDSWMG